MSLAQMVGRFQLCCSQWSSLSAAGGVARGVGRGAGFSGSSIYRAKKLGPSSFGAIGFSLDQIIWPISIRDVDFYGLIVGLDVGTTIGAEVDSNDEPFGLCRAIGTTAGGRDCPDFFCGFYNVPWI